MDLKKTIKEFQKYERSSIKKYPRDATQFAFFRYVLQLLAKISKQDIEEENIPQESGKQNFRCSACKEVGYVELWEGGNKKEHEHKVIEDCDTCKGEGVVILKVIDKRKITKDKDLYYDDEF